MPTDRFSGLVLGTNLTGTDNADGTITIDASGGGGGGGGAEAAVATTIAGLADAPADGAMASNPCSVVTMTASPTMIGDAELVNSSPVGRVFTCFPSLSANTTAAELESGVNSAVS